MEDHAAPSRENETEPPHDTPPPPARRRRFLKTLLGTAASGALGYATHPWLLGERQDEVAETVSSFLKQLRDLRARRSRRTGVQPHPPMAAAQRTAPVSLDFEGRAYETFLAGLDLKYIRPMEMLRPHFNIRGTVSNCLPPREAWKHIAPTLRVADALRARLGSRLETILSAYRSPAYNAACPGAAPHSYHVRNMALDLAFDCPPAEVVKAAEALREEGFFQGGIGRYPTFTHIDTRGYKADWG